MAGLSDVRTRETGVECRYVLFFDGLPTAYSSDSGGSGSILGSDGSTWMGRSETAIGGVETAGLRDVKPGLVLPDQIDFGGDPKGIGLDRSSVTFKIVDLDDTVTELFATDDVDPDILRQRVPPGLTALGTSVAAEGPISMGTGGLNPRGKWIGLERIGPSGERRMFPAIPFSLVGYDHQGDAGDRLPQVPISTSPLIHAGRMVTLYRIYADPDVSQANTARWYTWDTAHAAGDLVWWGVMQDTGTYSGNRVWSVQCYGPEALLERGLGQITHPVEFPIRTQLAFKTGVDDQIFINFRSDGELPDTNPFANYYMEGRQWTSITSTTKTDLIDEIDTLIKDTAAGTGTDYDTSQEFYDEWSEADDQPGDNAGLDQGGFFIRKNLEVDPAGSTAPRQFGLMRVAMHRKVWNTLGFDPTQQDIGEFKAPENETDVIFTKLLKGDLYQPGLDTPTSTAPGGGYYMAEFRTIALGYTEALGNLGKYDNEGDRRYYAPLFIADEAPTVIDKDGRQVAVLDADGNDSPFWEAQPTVPRTDDAAIDGSDTDSARWFVLKGKIRLGRGNTDNNTFEVEDEKDQIAVCSASWREGNNYGDVAGDLGPEVFIQDYFDPRLFGFDHARLKSDWVGTVAGDGAITIAPLNCYTFGNGSPIEWSHLLLMVLLLSTGTSTGFSAPLSEGGVLDLGDNQPAGLTSTGDVELADLGLGVPHQLVSSFADISGEFSKMSGGLGSDLNRMRLCYAGPFDSADALLAILKPRRMAMGLHGKKYGVFRFDQFSPNDADATITEDDLYGEVGDPTTVIPRQSIRAHGAIDKTVIQYGFEPGSGSKLQHEQKALDYNVRWRRGDLVEELNGRGLIPVEWLRGKARKGQAWKPEFRVEWGERAPEFFSKRHFILEDLAVSRPKGQDIMPGTRVLISNPWPIAPDGTRGLVNRIGRVIGVSIRTRGHATVARVLVYDDVDFIPHFSPYLFITNISGDTLTYDQTGSFTGLDFGDADTDVGWVRPSWTNLENEGAVRLWYQTEDGTWAQSGNGFIDSIDTGAGTITLTAPLSSEPPTNTFTMILTFEDFPSNNNRFPEDVYAPVTAHDGTFNGAMDTGKKWII